MNREPVFIVDWYVKNIILLRETFKSYDTEYDSGAFTWFLIKELELPSIWKQKATNLLMRFPGISGFTDDDYFYPDTLWDTESAFMPNSFYLDRGLVTTSGITPHRLIEEDASHDLTHLGYSAFCMSTKFWAVTADVISGDNFVTYIQIIMEKLKLKGSGDI